MARTSISYEGDHVGLFAMDPGRTTGLAVWDGTVHSSTADTFATDKPEAWQVDCEDTDVPAQFAEVQGAKTIADEIREITAEWTLSGIPVTRQFVVCEDFVLRPQGIGSTDRSGLAAVRVTSLVMGMLVGEVNVTWVFQMPAEAKARWTNDRLRRAGLWTRGCPHGNDATRHLALWVVKNGS